MKSQWLITTKVHLWFKPHVQPGLAQAVIHRDTLGPGWWMLPNHTLWLRVVKTGGGGAWGWHLMLMSWAWKWRVSLQFTARYCHMAPNCRSWKYWGATALWLWAGEQVSSVPGGHIAPQSPTKHWHFRVPQIWGCVTQAALSVSYSLPNFYLFIQRCS